MRYAKRIICGLLTVMTLTASCYADSNFSQGRDTYDDLIEITHGYSVESTNLEENAYNDVTNRTIAMILNTALSMNSENIYRLALESIYGGTDRSVENVMENAKNVWRALGSIMVVQNTGFKKETDESNNTVYEDRDSVNNVVNTLKRVLGDRASNLSPGMSVEGLWDEVCAMSQQQFGDKGGEFAWEESVAGGGDRTIGVGDQVFFAITAHLGSKEIHASYEDHYRKWIHGERAGETELLPRKYLNDENKRSFTVCPGSSVTLMWAGLVVDVDAETGSVRAACGNVDLSGLGTMGRTVLYDANGNALDTGTTGQAVPGSKGTVKLDSKSAADPEWYITITTKFCHNMIDYNSLRQSMYSSYTLPNGLMLDIDPDDPELVKKLEKEGGLEKDEAILVAGKVRLLQVYTDMTLAGVPKSEALAWITAMHYTAYEEKDGLQADTMIEAFSPGYKQKYSEWAKQNNVETNSITSITNFIMDCMNNDGIISEQVHIVALANVAENSPTDEKYIDLSNILNFFYNMDGTSELATKIINGRQFFAANSIEGQMWKFLQQLDQGIANMDYKVPNGTDVVGSGAPKFIAGLGGYQNTDISTPTEIEVRRYRG